MVKSTAFSSDANACVQTLLNLTSHGNAIIAEILRLKDNIPAVFSLETREEQTKYGEIIVDFNYFKNSEALEKKIASNPNLQELDDEIKESNELIIKRFYLAFENIYQYISDLKVFLEQLADGVFIQQSLDTILLDTEGKQLVCESLYLYGVMLMVCETYIPGPIRERLLVSWYRATASHMQTSIDKVCELLRDTGYTNIVTSRRPQHYPEELFRRVALDESFIEVVINRLRSEDIYGQINIYPLPEHRSTALATQSAMLVTVLFFSPNTLINESAKMREIVDKYFPDNWIVSIYMGITLNLIEIWEPYRAAKSALSNTVNTKNIKDLSQIHSSQIKKLIPQTSKLLQEGVLKEEKLSDNINKILSLIRECNVTLKWLMLHTNLTVIHYDNTKKSKQIRQQTITESKYEAMQLFQLLINTSLLELRVKEMLRTLLNNKEIKWDQHKKEAKERITELADLFSGEKPLPRVSKNENLRKWFVQIGKQIDLLKHDDMAASTKKIIQLIQALEEVQEFHQLHDTMQVKQWLIECREELRNMVRGGGLTDNSLVNLQVCSDLSYGWCVAKTFTNLGRDALKKDPTLVSHLRAVFLKLASALEIPLLRINQAASPDLLSVSQYYSNELVAYVREVLQIIPETVFSLLERIIELQTTVIKELPSRIEKDQLKEFAQLDERLEVARLTHSVSVFTSGILKMRTTLVGVICIDPKQLLEDGIRSEVSRLVNGRLKSVLITSAGSDLFSRVQQLAKHMDGYRRSFEYIQDYINIHGLKIWQEEVMKIINENVEEESSRLSRLKSTQHTGHHTNKNIFSCLVQDMFQLTDPKNMIYIENKTAWYDYKTHQETMSNNVIDSVQRGVGVAGLHGVAKVLGFRIAARLRHLTTVLPSMLQACPKPVFPHVNIPVLNAGKCYGHLISKVSKWMPQILDYILEVGTSQLLMKNIAYRLNTLCKFDSHHLEASLNAVNEAILNEVKSKFNKSNKAIPNREFLFELNELLERTGITQPYMNVYIKTSNEDIAYAAFLIVISHLKKLSYCDSLACLASRKGSTLYFDGTPFIIGIITLLRQYHSDCLNQFILYLSQYTLSYIQIGLDMKTPELSPEAVIALKFLEIFCYISETPQSFLENVIPISVLTQQNFMATKTA